MKKSTKVRLIIFKILIEVYKKNRNFDDLFDLEVKKNKLNNNEKTFIFNISLNTMRYNIHSKSILDIFVKKKLKSTQLVLLSSAVTQIVFLNIKPYAVVNETVEIAKKIGLYSSFINAVLNKIVKNVENLKKIKITRENLPLWFQKEVKKDKNINLDVFLKSYFLQPSTHLVFKSTKYLDIFLEDYEKSSSNSMFIKSKKKVVDLYNYKKGHWWVQNFSSMLPILLGPNLNDKNIIDLCAAPGGKAFQILSKTDKIILNDISKKRIRTLKDNLSRLSFNVKIENFNALEFPSEKKFDVVLLDSPCSSIGTIRSNPEILFKSKGPNLTSLINLQKKLLEKSSTLLKPKGIILYMVCSFFFSETIKPIEEFLKKNKNFSILKYKKASKELEINTLISKDGYFLTTPQIYKGYKIDGFFSIQLIKND